MRIGLLKNAFFFQISNLLIELFFCIYSFVIMFKIYITIYIHKKLFDFIKKKELAVKMFSFVLFREPFEIKIK